MKTFPLSIITACIVASNTAIAQLPEGSPSASMPYKGDNKKKNEKPYQTPWRAGDKDRDGALTFEEFRVGPRHKDLGEDEQENRFEAMDRNHDKKLTAEDFPPPPPGAEP